MPYFRIETNRELPAAETEKLLKAGSAFLSGLLGKPERVIMVSVAQGMPIYFNGDASPAAYVAVKSIGLAPAKCAEFSKAVCEFIEQMIDVPSDRIYIDFENIDGKMFGWNKKTF
jgi:phenylpyruvate tautomerase PptA (4-oxalocrotonate tautomerase family)